MDKVRWMVVRSESVRRTSKTQLDRHSFCTCVSCIPLISLYIYGAIFSHASKITLDYFTEKEILGTRYGSSVNVEAL